MGSHPVFVVFSVFGLFVNAFVTPAQSRFEDKSKAKLVDAFLQKKMFEHHIPGASLAVLRYD